MGKYDAFISYSTLDEKPEEVCRQLESLGLKCWIAPRNIEPGTPYARAIINGIKESDKILVFISTNSLGSEDVLNEIDNAHRLKSSIIPVFIERIELNAEFGYYLNRKQWINLFEENGIDKLIDIFNGKISNTPICDDHIPFKRRLTDKHSTKITLDHCSISDTCPAVFAVSVESTNDTSGNIEFIDETPADNANSDIISSIKQCIIDTLSRLGHDDGDEELVGIRIKMSIQNCKCHDIDICMLKDKVINYITDTIKNANKVLLEPILYVCFEGKLSDMTKCEYFIRQCDGEIINFLTNDYIRCCIMSLVPQSKLCQYVNGRFAGSFQVSEYRLAKYAEVSS